MIEENIESGEDGLPDSEDSENEEEFFKSNDSERENLEETNKGNLPAIKQTDLLLIAGKRGMGKTNLLLYIITELTKMNVNIIIVDPVFDLKENLRIFYGTDDERIINIKYGNRDKFNRFLYELFKAGWRGMIIVDEADKFFPNGKFLTDMENYFIQIGRHHGIGGIFVTRRLAKMHTDLASQCNKILAFKHWHRADLDYLREANLDDYVEYLRTLQPYEFLYMDTDVEYVQVCNPVPKLK